ncbi:class I SAM-dependent methyltransferase [Rhizobium sp. SSA_523]|uniref:class I SAM-dependent methyltransferase n=1 Tax=Rhizobium sp. SSA_523 TaxID=2952477 RepID=UPI0020903356|nr:methyltransferase domain-containing protein [Rhizobium sp. SSA_523]MCO5730316.1 methyltransferase domain-containing protein [Rhizobium sp. SSA_523]WKC25671.1 methyltransferase domain-containing protein [Rhizobium sp. SSA_523]
MDADHAARMDRMYRYQRHIYDLTRKYYLLGRDRAISELQVPKNGSLLEIGCGTGRNLMLAHRLYPTARLYGLDISAQMLATTRANFRGKAVQPVLSVADATSFTPAIFGMDGFDRVMVSYALSMIPDWEGALRAALFSVKPGGSLHIVDFGQQEHLPLWFRTGLRSWLARFHVTPRAGLAEALERQRLEADEDLHFAPLYRGYAWHAILRRRAPA